MADYSAITPDDLEYFANQRRRANQQYGYGVDQDQYQRQIAGNTYGRNLNDLKAAFAQSRDQLPTQYAHGGLLNSGIYARALDQWQTDSNRQTGNLAGAYNDQLAGLNLADRQLDSIRNNTLSDLDAQEKARRSTVAAALQQVGI